MSLAALRLAGGPIPRKTELVVTWELLCTERNKGDICGAGGPRLGGCANRGALEKAGGGAQVPWVCMLVMLSAPEDISRYMEFQHLQEAEHACRSHGLSYHSPGGSLSLGHPQPKNGTSLCLSCISGLV